MKKGFTLIELLVVVAIIGATAALVIPKFTDFSAQQNLKNTAEDLQANLRTTQNNATSGVKCPSGAPSQSGWFIEFPDANSYIIGKNCSDSLTPTPISVTTNSLSTSGVSISKIIIDTCAGDSITGVLSQDLKIQFQNISGSISYQNNASIITPCPSGDFVNAKKVTIVLSSSGSLKSVVVEKGGSIYVSSD